MSGVLHLGISLETTCGSFNNFTLMILSRQNKAKLKSTTNYHLVSCFKILVEYSRGVTDRLQGETFPRFVLMMMLKMPTDIKNTAIKIGSLFSKTGVTSLIEKTQGNAVAMAVDEVNASGGIHGQPLLLEESDPKCDLKLFKSETQRLIDKGVATFFGCYMSSTRKVTLPIIEQHRKLLFYPTFYEGFEFSPSCVYSGAVANQNSVWLADYLVDHYEKKYFFVGSNYVFPYESNRIMGDLLRNRGGEVIDEVYIPVEPQKAEINDVVARIKSLAPIVVYSTIVGRGAIDFYKAYKDAGIDSATSPISSLITAEPEFKEIGIEASVGHLTAAPYFSVIKSQQNAKFVAMYRSRFGADNPISATTEAAYMQVHLFAEAAKRAGATDRESILRVLPTFSFEAPQGTVRVHHESHHTYLWPKVAKANVNGELEIVLEANASVRPDPYLVEIDNEPRFYDEQILKGEGKYP